MTARWPFPDTVAFEGRGAAKAAVADGQISDPILVFVNLPMAALDTLSLQTRLDKFGQKQTSPA